MVRPVQKAKNNNLTPRRIRDERIFLCPKTTLKEVNKHNVCTGLGVKHKRTYLIGKNHPMFGVHRFGKDAPYWKGGKRKHSSGYILIYSPHHPFADSHKTVYEHRLVMEKHLQRFLKRSERVHHINRIPNDNRIENLQLFANISEHRKFHEWKKKQIEYYI